MATTKSTVEVRMYNMGFGDAFRITVRRGRKQWRMLVDCGVHSQGAVRPLARSVQAIIADLTAANPGNRPHLDVIVATHHHADHIAGFALDAWSQVEVDEVWLPYVEDEDDSTAIQLRRAQTESARRLVGLLDSRTRGLNTGTWPLALSAARAFAMNSLTNADATDRLLGRNGQGFANQPNVRYLPSADPNENVIVTKLAGVSVQVLGPPRDLTHLKRMNPPVNAGWLTLDSDLDLNFDSPTKDPLFNDAFAMDESQATDQTELMDAFQSLRIDQINNDAGLLSAAAILERVVNNTSLFFVLDVRGAHFVFPGDSQQGAWDHVLDNDSGRALVGDAVFYKIGHHGSHNGTPKRYIDTVLRDGAHAMLPWGLVKRWQKTIPKTELIDALHAHHHVLTRADAPVAEPGKVTVHEDLWSEVTFDVP